MSCRKPPWYNLDVVAQAITPPGLCDRRGGAGDELVGDAVEPLFVGDAVGAEFFEGAVLFAEGEGAVEAEAVGEGRVD